MFLIEKFLEAYWEHGIRREMVGDIIVKDNISNVFVVKEITKYLLQNLEKIGRERATVKQIKIENKIEYVPDIKEIKTTVASLRVDAIVSSCYGISREVSSALVTDAKVSVNYKEISNSSKQIKEGDLVSVRGYGRFILDKVLGETRKDRIRIILKVYGR